MTVIEFSDKQAAVLKAKAAAEGLTLEAWLQNLAEAEAPGRPRKAARYTLSELIDQCDPSAPLTEEDRAWLDAPPVGREF